MISVAPFVDLIVIVPTLGAGTLLGLGPICGALIVVEPFPLP